MEKTVCFDLKQTTFWAFKRKHWHHLQRVVASENSGNNSGKTWFVPQMHLGSCAHPDLFSGRPIPFCLCRIRTSELRQLRCALPRLHTRGDLFRREAVQAEIRRHRQVVQYPGQRVPGARTTEDGIARAQTRSSNSTRKVLRAISSYVRFVVLSMIT